MYHFFLKSWIFLPFRKAVGYLSDNEAFVRNLEQLKVSQISKLIFWEWGGEYMNGMTWTQLPFYLVSHIVHVVHTCTLFNCEV